MRKAQNERQKQRGRCQGGKGWLFTMLLAAGPDQLLAWEDRTHLPSRNVQGELTAHCY